MRTSLHGIKVLELARVLAGPYCGMLLADLGADVVKVEPPAGDDLRGWGPPFADTGDSAYFAAVNRNKRSVALDLRTASGRARLLELVEQADVVIENMRPGGLERLGLDPGRFAVTHPRLVHCSITAFGDVGPLASAPGYDIVLQAFSGLMSITGDPDGAPVRVGVAMVDVLTGVFACAGVLAALVERNHTGEGQHVQTSLVECALAGMPNMTAGWLQAAAEPVRLGNGHANASPYGLFPAADGPVVIAVGNDDQWARLVEAFDRSDLALDGRYARNENRVRNRSEVTELVTGFVRDLTRAEVAARLAACDIAAGPVNTVPEALNHPQVQALGMLSRAGQDGAMLVDSPFRPHASTFRPAPGLGSNTDDVSVDWLHETGAKL